MVSNLQPVNKQNPCIHCGKTDWCYRIGELSVCKRNASPAPGWFITSKQDSEGTPFYAPVDKSKKTVRPAQTRIWEYPDRSCKPFVRVKRVDDGKGGKPERWQERWQPVTSDQLPVNSSQQLVTDDYSPSTGKWVKGLKGIKRENIPIYRYQEVKEAITAEKTIFIVEGEPCADALWELGIPATTNIAGSGKWKPSDTKDLEGVSQVVLCPDRDKPGVLHMEAIAIDFPDAQWLYAFPNSSFWNNLPSSGGLDVADWIADYKLAADEILSRVEPKRTLPILGTAAQNKGEDHFEKFSTFRLTNPNSILPII